MWSSDGGAWQVRIAGNVFYKNVGDVILKGTSVSVPQDVIIENNIFGLDIDDRAYQLACFAVVMKGASYNKRLLRSIERDGIKLNIASIQETNTWSDEEVEWSVTAVLWSAFALSWSDEAVAPLLISSSLRISSAYFLSCSAKTASSYVEILIASLS